MLAMCFTGLFIHGLLPPSMISVVLVPIVKNKRISICSKNNYRPIYIALASTYVKLLEKIIYERVSEALETYAVISLDSSPNIVQICAFLPSRKPYSKVP